MLFIKVKVLILASSFFRIALGLQVPILYVFVLQLGGDLRHLGTIFAIYGVTYALMTFLITLYWLEYRHYLLSISFIMWALYALYQIP